MIKITVTVSQPVQKVIVVQYNKFELNNFTIHVAEIFDRLEITSVFYLPFTQGNHL